MNALGRVSLLFAALVLLVFGVVCLRQRPQGGSSISFLAPQPLASASIPPPAGQQPTILSGAAGSNFDLPPHQFPELSPVSPGPGAAALIQPQDFPAPQILAPIPAVPTSSVPESAGPAASPAEPVPVSSAVMLAPSEAGASHSERPVHAALPTIVETVADDSLWSISERVYGRGDFYKALYLHNRAVIARPDRIPAGIRVATPRADELRQLYPTAVPKLP